jgi:hypothetical protein
MHQNMVGVLIQLVYHPAELDDLRPGADNGHNF